jgi:hypothetical protein
MPGYIEFSNPVIVERNPNLLPVINKITMKSLFSNNSLVYYKPNTQSGGGVGTVRNARHIGKHT